MKDIIRPHWQLKMIENGLEYVRKYGTEICDHFIIDSNNNQVIDSLIRYFHGDPSLTLPGGIHGNLKKGILLIGKPGTGKTLLMQLFSTYVTYDQMFFLADRKKCPLTFPVVRCERIVSKYASYGPDEFEPFMRGRIVCFDDLGQEQKEAVHFGTRVNTMQAILEERYTRSCITLATTNHTIQALGLMYGKRVESRLSEMFNFIAMHGPDRRNIAYPQPIPA